MRYLEKRFGEKIIGISEIIHHSFKNFYKKREVLEKIKDKKYWLYVAEEDGKVRGFNLFYEDSGGEIYEWFTAVHPDYRNKGIATILMNIQFEIARSNGYSKIKLKTHNGHPEMISLCNKLGFVETKIEPNHWKNRMSNTEAIFFEYDLKN